MKNISYGTHPEQILDIYLPENNTFPVFIFFHGGGLKKGDKAKEAHIYERLVLGGIAVVSANYRMYPSARYPDFIEDAALAVNWVFKNMTSYGNVSGVFVGGSSAGGYLSQMLCFDKRWLGAHGILPTDIAGYVHDSGQPTSHFNVLEEKGIDSRRVIVDDSAPIYHIGTEPEYSPMLIFVSDNDMKNRYEQTMLLVSTLKHFGHTENVTLKVMNGTHTNYVSRANPDGNAIFCDEIYKFIKSANS